MNTHHPFHKLAPALAIRGVHLDLKGTPPVFERLLQLLDLFSALRFNLILMEWEDAFPWSIDSDFRSQTAYTEEEVRLFVEKAESLGLELVPLVQTLGHMENFLKAPGRIPLREIPECEDGINPLAEGASELLQAMIQDVLRLMPGVKRFHLGGDEAWSFGQHPQARAFVEKHGAAELYLHHMNPLFDLLEKQNIRPMLWHDMMLHWDDDALRRIAPRCDLVVWGYGEHPDETRHHHASRHIIRLAEAGIPLWGATAFKGADGRMGDRPMLDRRRSSTEGWVEVAMRYHLTGLITTGWSRYNYNSAQCESIEASLDTLMTQAILMYNGMIPEGVEGTAEDVLEHLWKSGEGKRFAAIRDAADAYNKAHRNMRFEEFHHIWFGTRRQDRRLGPNPKFLVNYEKGLKQMEQTGHAYRKTLQSLIPEIWLDQYFQDRLEGFRYYLEKTFEQGGTTMPETH